MSRPRIEDADDDLCDPHPPKHEENIPERRLWCAVLGQAVSDARGLCDIGESKSDTAQNKADAVLWFKSSSVAVGSYRWVLSTLGLTHMAGKIRAEALWGARRMPGHGPRMRG